MEEQIKAILQEMIGGGSDLGFCDPPSTLVVYANRQYPECLWYTWDFEGNKHNPILKRAIACVVAEIKVVEKEFRKKLERKLQVKVQADRAYTIESGLDTQFAKGLIASLDALGGDISKPIVIEAEAGETETVLFCRVYLDGESVRTPKHEDIDFVDSLGRISLALGGAELPPVSAPEAIPAAEVAKSKPVGKPVAKAVEPVEYMTPAEWGPKFKEAREKLGVTDKDVAVEILREAGIMSATALKPDRVDEAKLAAMIQAIADYMSAPQEAGEWEIEEEAA